MTNEHVTVLFTDMVGSTELASSLMPEPADELRRGHLAILRQAVAEAGGSEVKNLGDGLMVVFRAPSAAMSCAVAMQQGVERDGRLRSPPVGLRIGLSAGEVTREDDDYFGEPVIEAARLCALCSSGQVLASDIVRLTAGRRSRHECRSVGSLVLKGLPDAVDAVEVCWTPLGPDEPEPVVPLPGRLAVRPQVGVVGRSLEVAAMTDAFKRVTAGEGREVVLVSGEAGIGKTTVIAETSRRAFEAGACVLFGHSEEDGATPYQLFSEALGHLVIHAPEGRLVSLVDTNGSDLARLVPVLARRLPAVGASRATDPDTERHLVFAAVVALLGALSQSQPVVLVLDDLQWADRGSLQLLRHVIATDRPLRLLVLGTYRDAELSRSHPLVETLAELHRHHGVGRVAVAGLDDAGVASFVEAAAGHTLDDSALGLARALHRETDGNPFFMSEMLRHLSETGAITRDATGRWDATTTLDSLALPASIHTVIGARVGRLGPDAERALSLAAVIGRDFELDVLAGASGLSDDDLLDILDAAAGSALVRERTDAPGRYSFAHALIQHTLYDALGRTRQARAHRQVAEALEDLGDDQRSRELARHWLGTAQPDGLVKALDYSRRAADAALAALAPADALHDYAQALDLYARTKDPDPPLGVDLTIGLGIAQRQTGHAEFRETLLAASRRAAALGDGERLAAAALANNRGMFSASGTIDTERVESLEAALDHLPVDHPSRSLLLSTLCSELVYDADLERRQALADEAIALARSSGDDATIVRVITGVSFPLSLPHLLHQSLQWSDEALRRAEDVGDPALLYWAAHSRALVALCAGDIAEMDRSFDIAWSLAVERLHQPLLNWQRAVMQAHRAQIAGDNEEAQAIATEAARIGTDSGQPDADMFFNSQVMVLEYQRGVVRDDAPILEQFAQLPEMRDAINPVLANTHVANGRLDAAHQLLQQFAAADYRVRPEPGTWLTSMVTYAEVAVACNDTEIANELLERLAPFAGQVPSSAIASTLPVSHYVGRLAALLGHHEDADAYFADAADFNGRAGAKYYTASTNVAWATMLRQRSQPGDRERAHALLTTAQSLAAQHGYARVERDASAALQHLA